MVVLIAPVLTVRVFRSTVFTENAVRRLSTILAVLTLFVLIVLIEPTGVVRVPALTVFTFSVNGESAWTRRVPALIVLATSDEGARTWTVRVPALIVLATRDEGARTWTVRVPALRELTLILLGLIDAVLNVLAFRALKLPFVAVRVLMPAAVKVAWFGVCCPINAGASHV